MAFFPSSSHWPIMGTSTFWWSALATYAGEPGTVEKIELLSVVMLPSSLPLVRMYSRATADAPQRGRSMVAFIGGYALMWSAFGLAAFCFDASILAAVNSSSWLEHHEWWIGGSVLALAGAFQFTAL